MDGYNRRYGGDGIHEPLEWSAMEEQVASFKRDTIHKNIIDTELKEFPYPHTHSHHAYAYVHAWHTHAYTPTHAKQSLLLFDTHPC